MKIGQEVKVSPVLTGLSDWIMGTVIKTRKNKSMDRQEVAIKDEFGRIFFGDEKYFKAF